MVGDPRVLLIDGVTTGLDSATAEMILRALRRRATERSCSILVSIEQPPKTVLSLFDRALLMGPGGCLAFEGAPDAALDFMQKNCLREVDVGTNPFEFLVECLAEADPKLLLERFRDTEEALTIKHECEALFKGDSKIVQHRVRKSSPSVSPYSSMPSSLNSTSETSIQDTKKPNNDVNEASISSSLSSTSSLKQRLSTWRQVRMLCSRSLHQSLRDRSQVLMYTAVTIFTALFFGFVFFDTTNDLTGVRQRFGFVFGSIIFLSLLGISSIDHLVTSRTLFLSLSLSLSLSLFLCTTSFQIISGIPGTCFHHDQ